MMTTVGRTAGAAVVDITTTGAVTGTTSAPAKTADDNLLPTLSLPETKNEIEKKKFLVIADKDNCKYDTEMQCYIPHKDEKVPRMKMKLIKDRTAPKRSMSAFFYFCNDERGKVKALYPKYGVGDIARELGKRWNDADITVKQKYETMAEKDKARYEREMTEYETSGKKALFQQKRQMIAVRDYSYEDNDDEDYD